MCILIYTLWAVYLLHYGPSDRGVRGVQDLSHQHWLEEGPGDGSSCGIDHVQVHVRTKGSCTRKGERRIIFVQMFRQREDHF